MIAIYSITHKPEKNFIAVRQKGEPMKCDKCFFCTHIGKGVLFPYPVKLCKRTNEYKMPFLMLDGTRARQLDFNKIADCKIWHEVGCDIHPSTVAKAKRDFINSLIQERRTDE